jgi:NADPH:quinone reductase-like Zn-dependent oxidoreductase
MRVMEIREFGAPEMLVKAERPDPVLPASGSGEILIRVKAAGINRPDVLQRKGHYPVPAGASDIPGLEVAGEIIGGDLGHPDNAFGLKIGDHVCALVQAVDMLIFVLLRLHNVCHIQKGLPISRRHPFQKRFSLFGAMSFSGVN